LDDLSVGVLAPEIQNNALATYASKLNKEEAHLDFSRAAIELDCQIRAFNPFPVSWCALPNGERLRVWAAGVEQSDKKIPAGTVFALDASGLRVACGAACIAADGVATAQSQSHDGARTRQRPLAALASGRSTRVSKKNTVKNVRVAAAQVVVDVTKHGRSLAEVLPAAQKNIAEQDAALLAELCYGTLRCYFELDTLATQLLQKPPRDKDADIHALLLLSFYQLRCMRIAEHAAVNLAVDACRALKKEWAGKLLNGVLRSYLRQREKRWIFLWRSITTIPIGWREKLRRRGLNNRPQFLQQIMRAVA
jgi:transcription termination factor NusB